MKEPKTSQIIVKTLEKAPNPSFEDVIDSAKQMGLAMPDIIALFPDKMTSFRHEFFDYILTHLDQRLLESTEEKTTAKVTNGVWTLIDITNPYKTYIQALHNPKHFLAMKKFIWKIADHIWQSAGDRSSDYNYYTKRGLLTGVISTTLAYWLQDSSKGSVETYSFLTRQIDRVLGFGKMISWVKGKTKTHA